MLYITSINFAMSTKKGKTKVVIIGAGPAGLATAYELIRNDKQKRFEILILESDFQVGGLSKTIEYKGYRFDLGGHRFYTKFPEINTFYKTFLSKQMLIRKRLSRIYYRGKFYNYPLSAMNALKNLGLQESLNIFSSWAIRQFKKYPDEKTFNAWVANRFGDKLFQIFFKSYTEKVWGIPTSKLSADWAAQRIQDFNLIKALSEAIFKISSGSKTTVTQFYYPKLGPGMLYERLKTKIVKEGVKIYFNQQVSSFHLEKNKISAVIVKTKNNKLRQISADLVVSTMPFNQLLSYLNPPVQIKRQIQHLKFRNFITVNLIINSNPFPDQWIYIHEPNVKVGRIQNFKNWSPYMVKPNENKTPIGMEYFCNIDDPLWSMSDQQLLDMAQEEIVKIGLVQHSDIIDGFVCRVQNAYPVYQFNYQKPLKSAKRYISKFENLYLCGRGGLFRYNNQDHSILTGFYVARNIISGNKNNDVWSINEDDNYLERK